MDTKQGPDEDDTEGQRALRRAIPDDDLGPDEGARRNVVGDEDDTEGQRALRRAIPDDDLGPDEAARRS